MTLHTHKLLHSKIDILIKPYELIFLLEVSTIGDVAVKQKLRDIEAKIQKHIQYLQRPVQYTNTVELTRMELEINNALYRGTGSLTEQEGSMKHLVKQKQNGKIKLWKRNIYIGFAYFVLDFIYWSSFQISLDTRRFIVRKEIVWKFINCKKWLYSLHEKPLKNHLSYQQELNLMIIEKQQ